MSDSKEIIDQDGDKIIALDEMYKDYFLDYASYVILERAVPYIEDGLKPVQRRILFSLREKDDGRYHKVANIIGHTMQYHPHGDAAIGDAMVNIGQKNLLIDTQGNWGDPRTGDSAAAPRYIEARLTKFALEVAFNSQTTEWQLSYDGRNKEPIALPMKFPLLLAQGAEGIAVGLSTKILPHNFIELIKASIKVLEEKRFKLYPDFLGGGLIQVDEYQGGKRGGKVKVRARMKMKDKTTLIITELPYGVTTSSLIDSVVKANDKGQIKIKKIVDNTAADVEIQIDLPSGVSPEVTMDALYAFTNCEVSISPNACIIIDNKPHFLTVEEVLRISTERTKDLLRQELEIRRGELEEKWHMASLEKIFIEERIYRDIEEAESYPEALQIIRKGLSKYVVTPSEVGKKGPKKGDNRVRLLRDVTEEDLIKLTEVRIKRISKYNKFKHDEAMAKLLEELDQVNYDLDHLTDYAIAYFERLLSKYGKGKERKTEITTFETVKATRVVANNAKLYVNRKDGFIGTSLKKDEFISECSDLDDIIAFMKDGTFKVVKNGDKVFVGKNILHAAVWRKGDERTTYNLIYVDGKTGRAMAKRFHVTGVTRDRSYNLAKSDKSNRIVYLTSNPNGESETVQVTLSPSCSAHKKVFDFYFETIAIKGRSSGGNIVTKYPVKKVVHVELGMSSLGAIKIWMDESSGRLNNEERGVFLGAFDTGHQIITLYKDGTYEVKDPEVGGKIDMDKWLETRKYVAFDTISALYHDGEKGWTMVKRFTVETTSTNERYKFITEGTGSKLYYATTRENPVISYSHKIGGKKKDTELALADFIDVKGWKAKGNKLGEFKVLSTKHVSDTSEDESPSEASKKSASEVKKEETLEEKKNLFSESKPKSTTTKGRKKKGDDDKYQAGDTIELDF